MRGMTSAVTIGRVLRPFGTRGEVRVQSLTDVPGRFEDLPSVRLVTSEGMSVETAITHARPSSNGQYFLRFSAFSSPEEASSFRGALIQVPQESVPPAPDGRYYQFELVGLAVYDENHRVFGHVEEVLDLPQHPVLVVRQKDDEYLIPATHKFIRQIDIKNKAITVSPIEQWGLSDAV